LSVNVVQLIPGQHIHLIGIGGAGLSAIARVLLQQGFYISGSDRSSNALTEALERDGALIYEGHDASNVGRAEFVIVSSAVPADHVEVAAAQAKHIPVYKRADVMAAIMSGQVGIAVAGTHGKTTTTAMITHILLETGQRPSYVIGGILRTTNQNAGIGTGKAFVIEADEYDNMFLGLRPQVEIVTNIEWDHPDFFPTPNDITRAFSQFVGLLPPTGLLIACADDPTAVIFAENRLVAGLPVQTYGITNTQAMWQAAHIRTDDGLTTFEVKRGDDTLGSAALRVPGRHMVLNALAALIAADSQGVPVAESIKALQTFEGTGRRFDVRGEVDGVVVIDDYAHHPTAIRANIEAARQRYPERELWAVWQPHTYSRTESLMDDYLAAFEGANHVLVTDIYAAREQPIPGVTSAKFIETIKHPDARHTPALIDAVNMLARDVKAPAAILIMSAGDAPAIGEAYLKLRQENVLRSSDEPTRPTR
jgi:UDP-N-acetylmuramate--alanine ligase